MSKMKNRRSSVLLPFNATTNRTINHTLQPENLSYYLRNKKAPAKRQRIQVEIPDDDLDNEFREICEDMTKKLWTVYRISHLYNFNYSKPTTFPRYGRILSRHLVDSFTESVTLKATFVLMPDVQGFDVGDPPVHIRIEDYQLAQPRLVYEGILLSSRNPESMKLDGAVYLPILLARGAATVREKVHECLAALFSASVHEIPFPGEDMLWMIAAWSGDIRETKLNKEVAFLYEMPLKKDSIKCQYPVQFIKNLWHCIHDSDSRTVESHQVRRFHASLVKHTRETIGVNLAAVPLVMYKTPDFELHATGKVRVNTAGFIPKILHFIADLCETRVRIDFNPS